MHRKQLPTSSSCFFLFALDFISHSLAVKPNSFRLLCINSKKKEASCTNAVASLFSFLLSFYQ